VHTGDYKSESIAEGMLRLVWNPRELLLDRWNWKSAVFSSIFRANLFLATNLTAGRQAAVLAAASEFLFRFLTSGFYGALTQSFRGAEPPWAGALAVTLLLPTVSHSMELMVHWLRGTPNLRASIIASVCFTGLSTAFNWFAMRRGALVVGQGQSSIWRDLARMPRLIAEFTVAIVTLGRIAAPTPRHSGAPNPQ
jgi:hypothetical protein